MKSIRVILKASIFVTHGVKMYSLLFLGMPVRNGTLTIASVLKNDAAPDYMTIQLVAALCIAFIRSRELAKSRRSALSTIHGIVANTPKNQFSEHVVTAVDASIALTDKTEEHKSVAGAWYDYRKTHMIKERDGTFLERNEAQTSQYLNSNNLHYKQGFWRIAPR